MEYRVAGFCFSSELYHHGVKGQKWGIQNGPPYPLDDPLLPGKKIYQLNEKTKTGISVNMTQRRTTKMQSVLSRLFPSIKEQMLKDKQFDIIVDGQRIGEVEIFKESKDSLNVVWVGVDQTKRGLGYASAAMNGIVRFAKHEDFKQITLEVPGNSPDAKHIYEKIGFVETEKLTSEDDVWGGLTQMVLKI